ncbi:MAG: DciA family protein [Pseudomonadota bacterium]
MQATGTKDKRRRGRGFRQAGALVEARIRKAGEARGFAVAKLLTRWDEIAGSDIARMARPVEVSYGRGGFGATLVLLTNGANAPLVQMQEQALRERINACYGYAAIVRIRITQTARDGFAPDATPANEVTPGPGETRAAAEIAAGVDSNDLRLALETLGANVLTKSARATRASRERQDR